MIGLGERQAASGLGSSFADASGLLAEHPTEFSDVRQVNREHVEAAAREGAAPSGRPRVLDETRQAEVCAMLAAGCTFKTAARYVGCTAAAVSALLSRDAGFREKVDRAIAERELIPLSHMRAASGKSWRAAAWLLERTVKGTYRRDSLNDPVDVGDAVEKEVRDMLYDAVAIEQSRQCLQNLAAKLEER